MKETVHIAVPADDKYWFFAAVTAYTACRGSSAPVAVHLIDGGVSDEHFSRFASILGGAEVFRHPVDVNRWPSWHGSGITWSRLYLTEILAESDWVVSVDADVMFRGDISDLWNLRDDRYLILPSRDNPLPGQPYNTRAVDWYRTNGLTFKDPSSYFCAGLALLNLKAMRQGDWAERRDEMLAGFDKAEMPNADQCVLNHVLQDSVMLLPRQWGVFSGDENWDVDWSKSGAVHFVEDQPWCRRKPTHLASDLVEEWWDVAEKLGCGHGGSGWRGCRNRLDWILRRAAFLFFKKNQWLLKLDRRLHLHLRSTKGVPHNRVECAKFEVNSAVGQRVSHLRKMISSDCRVVVSSHTGVARNVLAVVKAKLSGRRIVREINDWPLSVIWGESRFKQWFEINVLPKLFDGAICMTDILVEFWRVHGRKGSPIFKLPMTVDVKDVDRVGKGREDGPPYVCYAGGLNEEKDGVETLKRGFECVKRSFREEGRGEIELRILNGMEHDEVIRNMKSAECLVLARPDSLQARAGFPTKLGEYLSTGRPVVVTGVGEISAFLKDGVNAYVVNPVRDRSELAEKMAEKILAVLSDGKYADEIGASGRKVAEKCFDWRVYSRELNEWLSRVGNAS
ncbi:MAG: glycosyltransferase [Kiritimatiellae bacterium]|nr:glycosyltransferase [Kiritimatiellia bacterium]